MPWGNRTIQGTVYTFHHLQSFTLVEKGIRVRVSLGAHVFTRIRKPGDATDLLFKDGRTHRTFCQTRYGHSLHLPAAIMAGAAGYIFSNHSKCVFKANLPGLSGHYVIAFEMRKSSSAKYDVKIQVVSAHHRPHTARMPRCTFDCAATALMNGAAVPWTKK